ncbi:MazG family protein [Malonomonas rubra]|uniref:MazG family protein n=1 Tax=Malonomonas rubra TaxID=57040 RepID=UPI0026F233C2|nr:MazG family protein [Malonomonas rubra]
MSADKQLKTFRELIDIMALLRSENGCPWDRQQTPESLKKHILEESYELLEAIDTDNPNDICDELGDLLLQIVFQAQIFSEKGNFDIADVAKSISEKLKRRHPHIFDDASYEGHEQRWEEIKRQERSEKGLPDTLAQRLPKTLPALKRCTKFAKKCPQKTSTEILAGMHMSLKNIGFLTMEYKSKKSELEEEMSQLLLAACKLAAVINLDPEDLLRKKTSQLIYEIDSKHNL